MRTRACGTAKVASRPPPTDAPCLQLVKLFQSKKTSSRIDREHTEGGLCSNFIASISWTQGGDETKVWANDQVLLCLSN